MKPVNNGTRCQRRQMGDQCDTSEDCSIAVPNSTCVGGLCACAPGHHEADVTSCVLRRLGQSPCSRDADCEDAINHSACSETGICVCQPGYRADNRSGACLLRKINDACDSDADCDRAVADSRCEAGRCLCVLGYYHADLTSCTRRALGDPTCVREEDCSAVVANSTCLSYTCVCPPGFQASQQGDVCVARVLGSNCTVHTDCSAAYDFGECVEGSCGCARGYRGTHDGKGCVLRALGDACDIAADCDVAVTHSTCTRSQCRCLPSFKTHIGDVDRLCVPRMVGDVCSDDADCSNVRASRCLVGRCACQDGYDVIANKTDCVKQPRLIGQRCYFPFQCRLHVHPSSLCDPRDVCTCPDDHYVTSNRTACQPLAERLGEKCERNEHCHNIAFSTCNAALGVCQCVTYFFADRYHSVCQPFPRRLDQRCLTSSHCQRFLRHTECLQNQTCACVYGFLPRSSSRCVERPVISIPEVESHRQEPASCSLETDVVETDEGETEIKVRAETCNATLGRKCVPVSEQENTTLGLCLCPLRSRAPWNDPASRCIAVQTYQVTFNITEVAGRYDYHPLDFPRLISAIVNNSDTNISSTDDDEFRIGTLRHRIFKRSSAQTVVDMSVNSNPAYLPLLDRLTIAGISEMMTGSEISNRYVDSEVVRMSDLHPGMQMVSQIHVNASYLDAMDEQTVLDSILDQLERSDGELGKSRFKIGQPFNDSVKVEDFDECASSDSNDCAVDAWCINTLGSYYCVCHVGFDDTSDELRMPKGRQCSRRGTTTESSDSCSAGDCETDWTHVALILTGFFLAITAMIIHEICQRQQSNTARDLYERFGTSSMRRLQRAVNKARDFRSGKSRDPFFTSSFRPAERISRSDSLPVSPFSTA